MWIKLNDILICIIESLISKGDVNKLDIIYKNKQTSEKTYIKSCFIYALMD